MIFRHKSIQEHITSGKTIAIATSQKAKVALTELKESNPSLKIIDWSHKAPEIYSHWAIAMDLPAKERKEELKRWATSFRYNARRLHSEFDATKLPYDKLLIVGSKNSRHIADAVALMFKKLHAKPWWAFKPPVAHLEIE